MNCFEINDSEQEYLKWKSQPKDQKYASGSVEARVRLMVSGGCQPVRGFKGMEWKYADDLCECEIKKTEIHVFSSVNYIIR